MKLPSTLLLLAFLYFSCSERDKLEGTWKSSYINEHFMNESNIIFQGFDLFDEHKFEPLIQISNDSLRYDLGFGQNAFNLRANFCSIEIGKGQTKLNCAEREQIFDVEFRSRKHFCLLKEKETLACFSKYSVEQSVCEEYNINLNIKTELHNILLELLPQGVCQIIRRGVVSDTLNFVLEEKDQLYYESLIGLINERTFTSGNRNIGGDFAKYKIKIECNDKVYHGELFGLKEISFEMKALIINLENLVRKKYGKD